MATLDQRTSTDLRHRVVHIGDALGNVVAAERDYRQLALRLVTDPAT